ncbi:MAG: hypothetical protein HFH08_01715 [Bacilli bacterium]|nr:hypothetical protein [Bacilli bacterium]
MKDEIKKQLINLLDKHIKVLGKKEAEQEDLHFIVEVLNSLLGKINENELESLLEIDENELKDLEHLFKDEKEKALIHRVSGVRYLVAGIRDKHVHIDITKDQKQLIASFLRLLQEKKNMIVPILKRDKGTLEQDKSKQLLEKLEDLNSRTYLSEVDDIKRLFIEFDISLENQYQILYSVLEHNQTVYTSLKQSLN